MACSRRAHRQWSDGLPVELLAIVLLHLPCLADRVCFAVVCRAWRSAALGLTVPRQLPWLLLPSPTALTFVSLQSGPTRDLYPTVDIRGARLYGSHGGGWVTVSGHARGGHEAINIVSGARVPLPDRLSIWAPKMNGGYAMIACVCSHSLLIRTVVFSAAPTAPGCLAAAHIASATNLAFCRPGARGGAGAHWTAYHTELYGVEDIAYHESERYRGFHVLSNKEGVAVYFPTSAGGELEMARASYHVKPRAGYLQDLYLTMKSSIKRYLVESRGRLLMVLRFYNGRRGVVRRTYTFQIYEMELGTGAYGRPEASWVEVKDLPGRALFLGHGCSRAVEVSQLDGIQEGSIYYLDDIRFDASVALDGGKSFYSVDMGVIMYKVANTGGNRVPHFPRRFASQSSPPIWFLIE